MLPSKTHCPFATLKVNTDAIKKAIKQAVEALKTHPEVEAAKVPFAEIVWLLT
jgi:ribosomal protein L23